VVVLVIVGGVAGIVVMEDETDVEVEEEVFGVVAGGATDVVVGGGATDVVVGGGATTTGVEVVKILVVEVDVGAEVPFGRVNTETGVASASFSTQIFSLASTTQVPVLLRVGFIYTKSSREIIYLTPSEEQVSVATEVIVFRHLFAIEAASEE